MDMVANLHPKSIHNTNQFESSDNNNKDFVGYIVSTIEYNEYPVVELSKEAFCQNIFGVISSSPKCVREAYFRQKKISINSNGQGDIWVCNYGNNQNIKRGTLLTSSSIAGLAMCQYKNEKLDNTIRNYTVAKIMKDIDFVNDTNKIYVNINLLYIYYRQLTLCLILLVFLKYLIFFLYIVSLFPYK